MSRQRLTRKDRQELFERLSKYLEDVSKLVLAGVVLTAIMKEDVGLWWLIGCGTMAGGIMLYASYKAFVKSKR